MAVVIIHSKSEYKNSYPVLKLTNHKYIEKYIQNSLGKESSETSGSTKMEWPYFSQVFPLATQKPWK